MASTTNSLLRRATERLVGSRAQQLQTSLARMWGTLTLPATIIFLLWTSRIHPDYALSWRARAVLCLRMWRNTRRIWTGTSYKAHLAMAVKLLELPREREGAVVECGCYLGGSTANLSLVCAITGRELIVYDSFEGLPPPSGNDRFARETQTGFLHADLERVKANVRRWGRIDHCSFRKGFFDKTLPTHREPIVLAFLDVDYQASLDECIRNLWPHLVDDGYVFVDEYIFMEYCALFWSERYWRENFATTPPGLIGSGTGVGVGQYYLGPATEWNWAHDPASVAYTRKDFSGYWGYDPQAKPIPDDERDPIGGPF